MERSQSFSNVSTVTLSRVVVGHTKPPVSISQFQTFLSEVEAGDESLQFYLVTQYLLNEAKLEPEVIGVMKKIPEIETLIDMQYLQSTQKITMVDKIMDKSAQMVEAIKDSTGIILKTSELKTDPSLLSSSLGHRSSTISLDSREYSDWILSQKTHKSVKQILQWVVDRYIIPNAPRELNIVSEMRKSIINEISTANPQITVLSRVQQHVFELLAQNSMPRFLRYSTSNIGDDEIAERKREGVACALLTVILIILSFTLPPAAFPRRIRWVIVLPAGLAAIMVLQVKASFCVIYGLFGKIRRKGFALYGFLKGTKGGVTEKVVEACIRTSQLRKSALYTLTGILFGVLVAGVTYAIPYNI